MTGRRRHPIPPKRRRRRRIIWTILLLLILAVILLARAADMRSATESDVFVPSATPVVHVFNYDSIGQETEQNTVQNIIHHGDTDEDIARIAERICEQYGNVDPLIVRAIIEVESGGDRFTTGDNGRSLGLMQINRQWHEERISRLGVIDLLDMEQNILVGVDFLSELYATGNDEAWVLMAYNGGISYAEQMEEEGIVSSYVDKVLSVAESLQNNEAGGQDDGPGL